MSGWNDGFVDPWDWFDALSPDVRRAHQTINTGLLFRRPNSDTMLCFDISPEFAKEILEKDSGKMLLSAEEVNLEDKAWSARVPRKSEASRERRIRVRYRLRNGNYEEHEIPVSSTHFRLALYEFAHKANIGRPLPLQIVSFIECQEIS